MQVVGPSGSGKTLFVCNLFRTPAIFQHRIKQIHWFGGCDEGENGQTKRTMFRISSKKIKFYNGFVDEWDKLAKKGDAMVIDDLFHEANKEKNFVNLFTKIARHRHVFVVFITQNLFHQGGNHLTRNLNVHYLVIFRNPRDQTVIGYLARQIYPRNSKFLVDAFNDATKNKPHSYLFFDFTQQCDDTIRVRTDIFNQNGIIIYKQSD